MQDLLNLITVVKSQLLKIHDIFFATTPALVTIKRIKSDNTIEEVEIPNIAKINADIIAAGNVIPLSGAGDAAAKVILQSEESLQLNNNSAYLIEVDVFGYAPLANTNKSFLHHKASLGVKIAAGTPATDVQYNIPDGTTSMQFAEHSFLAGAGEFVVGINSETLALEVECTSWEFPASFWGTAKIKKMTD